MLYAAAALLTILALIHSILGERYILIRLFRRGKLPKLFGGTEFTQRTMRFAWHITTVFTLGLAVLLVQLEQGRGEPALTATLGWTLLLSGFLPLIYTRGRHLSWLVLFVAGGLCLMSAQL